MEDNNWYKSTEKKISSLKEKVSRGDYKLYELEVLSRVVNRVDSFSSDCEDCQAHRNDISNLVAKLDNLPMNNEDIADYSSTFRSIIEHLKKRHGLHRTFGLILPIAAVVVAPLLFMISLSLMSYGFGTDSYTLFVSGLIVLGVAVITGVIGISRLFIKRI